MSDPSVPPPPSAASTPPPPAPPQPAGGFAPPPAPQAMGAPGGLRLSTKGKRFGAALLEALLVLVTLFIGWMIWSLVIWSKGQTPAKSLLGMRVVMAQENRPAGFGDMAMREVVGKWLLGFIPFYSFVGALFVLFDDNNQALWDKVASTTVVEDPNNAFGL